MSTNGKSLMVFCDFDGTLTRQDVVDLLLEKYATPEWRGIEEEWVAGRITARECLDRQMACVRAGEGDFEELLNEIDLDAGFPALASWARAADVPLVVFSDGFDWIINRLFAKRFIDARALNIRIFASHLEFISGRPMWSFPHSNDCEHGCGSCKPAIVRRLHRTDAVSVVIGDGRSDRFAVECADEVFAKGWLEWYCAKQRIPHQQFSCLSDVTVYLSTLNTVTIARTTSL